MRSLVVGVCISILCSAISMACKTDGSTFSTAWQANLNLDYNDFGRIHQDAEDPACAEIAKDRLIAKLQSALANPAAFTGWLEGYHVALIFGAANRLGANGWATKELDQLLSSTTTSGPATVDNRYTFTSDPLRCDDVNTCMDDHASGAVAYAWIAAYRHRRLYSNVNVYQGQAKYHIDKAFESACINDRTAFNNSSRTEICNGLISDLWDGTGTTLSMNHAQDENEGPQQIPYGLGLMPSIASAIIGLETSGYTGSIISVDQQRVATALFEEAQAHTANNAFEYDCEYVSRAAPGSAWSFDVPANQYCGGPFQYQATMYRLDKLYQDYLGGIPGTPYDYQANLFNPSNFALGSSVPPESSFFSFGRYVGFFTHGYEWLANRPEFLPEDHNNPIGYLEGINASGVASGWTCDQDTPGKSIFVSFLVDSQYFVLNAKANLSSEPAIAAYCGGTAHRFSVQLPAWTQGRSVSAFGLDYTWYGHTFLPCLNSPGCGW